MPDRARVATPKTRTQEAPPPQSAAASRVERARRAAQNSPGKRGPTTGHPGKGHRGQVGAAGASRSLMKAPLVPGTNTLGCIVMRAPSCEKNQHWDKGHPTFTDSCMFCSKKNLLDSAFMLCPSVCPLPQPAVCLSTFPVVTPSPSHSSSHHLIVCLLSGQCSS